MSPVFTNGAPVVGVMVSVYDAALLDACHASAGVAVTKAPFGGVAFWNAPGAAKAARDSAAKAASAIPATAISGQSDMTAGVAEAVTGIATARQRVRPREACPYKSPRNGNA